MNRNKFEDCVFMEYYIRSIKRNTNIPSPKIAGCLDFVPTATLSQAELCERKGDDYVRPEISAMYMGWKLRDKLETKNTCNRT